MIRVYTLLPAMALTATMAVAQEDSTAAPAAPEFDAEMAYESARNQLGVLKYCQESGHIDGTAVEIQERLLTMLPTGDAVKGDAAEEKGKAGTVSAMGAEQTLEAAAAAQSTTEDALCKQMDTMIQQLAAQLPA
mgnify:CR=1 FL=1